MKRKITALMLASALFCSVATGISAAAGQQPVELAAETIEYDTNIGLITATGGVRMTQANAVMTGTQATYNTKTQEALLTGGVKAVKDDATLTAAQVQAYNNNHLVATGDVVLVKADSTLTGSQVDYYTDRGYAEVINGAKLTTADGVMTANTIEAFLDEDRAVGKDNVHIVSDVHKLDAVSDLATYYGSKSGQGRVVLTGNARAVQEGNVLTGNSLTIHLDDSAMSAQGRTKLVITPK